MPTEDILTAIRRVNAAIDKSADSFQRYKVLFDRYWHNVKLERYLRHFPEVEHHLDDAGLIRLDHDDDRIHFMLWQK